MLFRGERPDNGIGSTATSAALIVSLGGFGVVCDRSFILDLDEDLAIHAGDEIAATLPKAAFLVAIAQAFG